MNQLINAFRLSAERYGQRFSIQRGKIIGAFGLDDFLENKLQDADDAPTIAVKALTYFCEGEGPQSEVFMFAVMTVGIFLNEYHARRKSDPPQQPLKDLVSLLRAKAPEEQIRGWIKSNFG
jgi:hypothetical protein